MSAIRPTGWVFGVMAGEVGGAVWAPLLVALLLALLTAASYAELVTKYPRAGGSAVFAERASGSPLVSFLVGSCMLAAGLLLVVVVLGAVVLGRGDGDLGRLTELPPGVSVASGVLAAALLAYYSFVGFETSANVAEEVRDVRRVYPRALFGALLVAGLVYVLAGVAAAVTLAPEELATPRARCSPSCRQPTPGSPTACSAPSPSSRWPTGRSSP